MVSGKKKKTGVAILHRKDESSLKVTSDDVSFNKTGGSLYSKDGGSLYSVEAECAILAWNCRGLGKLRAVRELTDLVRTNKPKIVGLFETKIDLSRIRKLQQLLGFKNGLMVNIRGIAGGIALWWAEDVDIQILSYSESYIDARWHGAEQQCLTLFYGSPYIQNRQNSWNLLRTLHQQLDLMWLVFEDFNEVCFSWEVKSNRISGEWQMRNFREAIDDCRLIDLGFQGNPFTFSNKRKGSLETRARLDRVLASHQWNTLYPMTQVSHIACSFSDHFALLIHLSGGTRGNKTKKRFLF